MRDSRFVRSPLKRRVIGSMIVATRGLASGPCRQKPSITSTEITAASLAAFPRGLE